MATVERTVQRTGEAGATQDSRRSAVFRFMVWESLGFLPLALVLLWLHVLGPARPEAEALKLTMIAVAIFVIYVGVLFARILLPVLKGSGNAR